MASNPNLGYHGTMRFSSTFGRFALLLALLFAAAPGTAGAGSVIDSAKALAGVAAGDMILIDVRSPQEWRETGVPQGAKAVTIHNPDGMAGFVAAATRAVNGKKDQVIALICARGWRSFRAANALRDAGFTNIMNVREGMLGNPIDGPGWLDRKLPVERCKNC
jgi:rhodanese-related sulfurtransferase